MPLIGSVIILLVVIAITLILFPILSGGYDKLTKHFIIEEKEEKENDEENI